MQLHIASCRQDTVAFGKCEHFVAGMRAIDLSCLLLAPIAAGFLMTYTSISTAILAIAAWNLVASVNAACWSVPSVPLPSLGLSVGTPVEQAGQPLKFCHCFVKTAEHHTCLAGNLHQNLSI